MFDLHRHDEFSTFDGSDNARDLAVLAKELGHNALCTTNHGNTYGLIATYRAAREVGIKPILGCEGYFLPRYKPKTRGYHLVLIAKDLKGYGNLNRLQYEGEKHKYYNPIWDLSLLRKYREGLICTTACVASYMAQAIKRGNKDAARRCLSELKAIFADDLYIEIQPYTISERGLQEQVNREMYELARELDIKTILTSDSHRGRKDDLDAYLMMHRIAGHNMAEIEQTYKARYMPGHDDMAKRFVKMHGADYGKAEAREMARDMYAALDEIYDKCQDGYLDDLPLLLPASDDSHAKIMDAVKNGLKQRGKWDDVKYRARAKKELEVIRYHGFEDYFMIVADYVRWAKEQGIAVGPGRGSVCNSLVAYALGITNVDSILFGLDFYRFMRKDKTSYPDIDLDFQTSRRQEVVNYLCHKYEGKAARISSYGLYRVDNLINDLAKVCGLVDYDERGRQVPLKGEISAIKSVVNKYVDEQKQLDVDGLRRDALFVQINADYNNILEYFIKFYLKVRFFGSHAAGVAITGGNLLDYSALRIDSKTGTEFVGYDLDDLESINVIKFDLLGLNTMESLAELRAITGRKEPDYEREMLYDDEIYTMLRDGRSDGVFQLDTKAPREMLQLINCDCFDDLVAVLALNRPGPLKMGMHTNYAYNKAHLEDAKQALTYDIAWQSYGVVIYQEQVMRLAHDVAGLDWPIADKIMKSMKESKDFGRDAENQQRKFNELRDAFIGGVIENGGYTRDEAEALFSAVTAYTFNRGHAVGYALISLEEAYYKRYYPNEYWYVKLKYARDDKQRVQFEAKAVEDGSILFIPHVNYSEPLTSLRTVEGERVIQFGLSSLKNVGEKAAAEIYAERKLGGIFKSFDDFYDRCKSRLVTSRVLDVLKEQGALEFNKKTYLNRVTKFNSSLYAKSQN